MSVSSIARANGTGVDTIKSAVLELEKAGYLTRSEEQSKNADGTFADFVWTTTNPFQNPVTVKPVDGFQDTKKTTSKEEQEPKKHAQDMLEPAFSEFWKAYPRKVGKVAAKKAFVKAWSAMVSDGSEPTDILTGVALFARDPNKPSKEFLPHPSTWLNEGRWDDEPYPEREKTKEELEAIRAEQYKRRREIELAEAAQRRAEAKEAEERLKANPVTRCEHDRVKVICPICSPVNVSGQN